MRPETDRLRRGLDAAGVLLQHDRALPSATAVVVGEPVAGSWWAHPLANPIYDALNELEDGGGALRCKLVAGKVTLVAPRLWPELLAVGSERAPWQLDGVGPDARALLAVVDEDDEPLLVDGADRAAAKELARALLVHETEVHLPSGRHTKALQPWRAVAAARGVVAAPRPPGRAGAFDAIVGTWPATRRLLPWPLDG